MEINVIEIRPLNDGRTLKAFCDVRLGTGSSMTSESSNRMVKRLLYPSSSYLGKTLRLEKSDLKVF